MTRPALAARFLPTESGRLFVTWREPEAGCPTDAILVAPALAEEMNKSRALLRDLSITVADLGCTLVIADLYGTGDSDGELADARLGIWVDNLESVANHFEAAGYTLRGCLGIRGGGLVACRWLVETGRSLVTLALWQPQSDGKQVINQWLRLRAAASMFDGSERVSQKALRDALAQGDRVMFSGYELSPQLAADLEATQLETRAVHAEIISLFEVGRRLSPAAARLADDDERIKATCIEGEPFWGATEIVRNPELVQTTARALVGFQP